jgi:cysteine desulfurase
MMFMDRIYLDNNATTPTDGKVLEEMLPYFDRKFANPLSLHFMGKEAKEALELARRRVAEAIDCDYSEVIFTSGGSESNNTVIKGLFFANDQKGHIITSTVEHPAVLQTCRELEKLGAEVTYIDVDEFGLVNPEEVKKAIKKNTILVSIMHGNNEVGTLEPVDEIAKICNEEDVPFHTDAVQSIGKVPVSVKKSGYDFLSLSAHKFNGPKGVGALIARKGKRNRFEPLLYGGGHEGGLRASTHNVPGIVGLGSAIELATQTMVDEMRRVKKLRDTLANGILENIPDTELLGHPEKRLPTTLNIAFKYIEGEGILLHLSNKGIAVSTGSACASGKLEPSHVIINMGFPAEIAQGAVRFSLGKINTQNDIDKVMEVLPPIIARLREISPLTPEDYGK